MEFLEDPMAEDREKVDITNTEIDEDDICRSEQYESARIEHRKAKSLEAFL